MSNAVDVVQPAPGVGVFSRQLTGVARSPWAVAGVVFAIYGLWLAAMFHNGYDARDSIVLGKRYVQQGHVSSVIKLDPHFRYPAGGSGYDGQFFYFIAADPINARYYMDSPSYRYTKILYPVVARILALGQATLVPYTLILTNWLAIAGAAGLLGAWLRRKGMSPWFALVYALCPGVWVSFERDLTEPLSYALVVLAVYLYDSRTRFRVAWSGVAFALAILARDKAAIFAALYGMGVLVHGLEGPVGAWVREHTGYGTAEGGRQRSLPWRFAAPRRMENAAGGRPQGATLQRVTHPSMGGADECREGAGPQRDNDLLPGEAGGLRLHELGRLAGRNVVEAGVLGVLAVGPYLLWRLFLRHWLHASSSVSGVSTSYQASPLAGALSSAIDTTTRVMYLFVLFIPALICVGMGLWALVRRVWAVPIFTLLVLVDLSVVTLNPDYFVDVYGVLRVEAGVILAATFCLPYFNRLTRGNSLWFYACGAGWLLLTVGYMLLAPAWLLGGRA